MSKKPQEPLVLVGFGKHDLVDMLEWRGTVKEKDLYGAIYPHHWPPRWRAQTSCSEAETQAFLEYLRWLENVKGVQ